MPSVFHQHFGFVWETPLGKSRGYRDVIVFEKPRFQNVFRPQENAKPAFSISSGLKSVFGKLHFREGLVWAVGLNVEIKLFPNFSGVGWRAPTRK